MKKGIGKSASYARRLICMALRLSINAAVKTQEASLHWNPLSVDMREGQQSPTARIFYERLGSKHTPQQLQMTPNGDTAPAGNSLNLRNRSLIWSPRLKLCHRSSQVSISRVVQPTRQSQYSNFRHRSCHATLTPSQDSISIWEERQNRIHKSSVIADRLTLWDSRFS